MIEKLNSSFRLLGRLPLWPRLLSGMALGAISALAMPPVDAWWILGFTFPALLGLTESLRVRQVFFTTLVFAFGYFLAVLHWIGFAFLVNAGSDLWMMPFAVGGLAVVLGLFWACGAGLAKILANWGLPYFITLPFSLSLTEWLRGHLFTGFPWAVPGQAVDGMGGVEQLASVIGMTGLTYLVLTWASIPYVVARGRLGLAVAVFASLPISWGWGVWRLAHTPQLFMPGVVLRLVQPNLSQDDKWRTDNARKIFDGLLALSAGPPLAEQNITHIIWPESAVPFLVDESPEGLAEIQRMLGPDKILLTGAVRRSSPRADAKYFTSVLVIDGTGKVLSHYDKAHLVPGGEFLPLAWLLEPLGFRQVVDLPESFTNGPGPESLSVPGAGHAIAQICYEAIFPESAAAPGPRADWLINVTNDGWFGNSAGPWQHLAQMRLRAIEQGLPVARAANTGISAVIDPVGRSIFQSEIAVSGAYDAPLPLALPQTLYARFGDNVAFGVIIFGAILLSGCAAISKTRL